MLIVIKWKRTFGACPSKKKAGLKLNINKKWGLAAIIYVARRINKWINSNKLGSFVILVELKQIISKYKLIC